MFVQRKLPTLCQKSLQLWVGRRPKINGRLLYMIIIYDKIIYNESNVKCDEMKDCLGVLKNMIDIRDGFKQGSILSSDDIDYI